MEHPFEKYISLDAVGANNEQLLKKATGGCVIRGLIENEDASSLLDETCHFFLPIFQKSFNSGFVCVPIENYRAEILHQPNLMITVDASESGLRIGYELLFNGINVHFNVYSLSQYEKVMKLYLRAVEDRDIHYKPLKYVASMVSFDVAAIDNKVQENLSALHQNGDIKLHNKAAIALVRLARSKFERYFSGDSWTWLADHGATPQRFMVDVSRAADPQFYINALREQVECVCLSADQFDHLDETTAGGITAYPLDAGMVLRDLGVLGIHLDELGESLVES